MKFAQDGREEVNSVLPVDKEHEEPHYNNDIRPDYEDEEGFVKLATAPASEPLSVSELLYLCWKPWDLAIDYALKALRAFFLVAIPKPILSFWTNFGLWFVNIFTVDLRSLAFVRIGLGICLLCDISWRWSSMDSFLTAGGLVPCVQLYYPSYISLIFTTYGLFCKWDELYPIMFTVNYIFSFFFLIGYKTKLSTIICWWLLISVQQRNEFVLNGGDIIFACSMFWMLFAPSGERYSVDAALNKNNWLGNKREDKTANRVATSPPVRGRNPLRLAPHPDHYFSFGTVGLLIQPVLMYYWSWIFKYGESWENGSALYYALHASSFSTAFAGWLREQYPLTVIGTHLTILFEGPMQALWFVPIGKTFLRAIMILAVNGFHWGIFATLKVGLFCWVPCILITAWTPSSIWDFFGRVFLRNNPRPITFYYSEEKDASRKIIYILKTLLFLSHAQVDEVGAASNDASERELFMGNHLFCLREDRQFLTGYKMFVACLRNSQFGLIRLLSLLFNIPLLFMKRRSNTSIPEVVKPNSRRSTSLFVRIFNIFFPLKNTKLRRNNVVEVLAIVCIIYVLMWNAAHAPKGDPQQLFGLPESLMWIGRTIRINQVWSMFAPNPLSEDGWYNVIGKLPNGTDVELIYSLIRQDIEPDPLILEQPELISATYPTQRWRKYFLNIGRNTKSRHTPNIAKLLCLRYNTDDCENCTLVSVKVQVTTTKTPPPGGIKNPPHVTELGNYNCTAMFQVARREYALGVPVGRKKKATPRLLTPKKEEKKKETKKKEKKKYTKVTSLSAQKKSK